MLVLGRKLGEQIVVPSCGLTVTVISVQGKNVRLGFTAPPDVEVYREEVWQRMEWTAESGATVKEHEHF